MSKYLFLLLIVLSWAADAVAQDYNYGEVLQKSILFYETQQSGDLPDWNRISWRDDAGETDGQDVGLDLSGGWFDAGDHIKFGLPMAFSATLLNWGYIEFEEGYEAVNQDEHFKRNLKWVTDYFIKCHSAPNEFYAQISASDPDHSFWIPAEMVNEKYERLSYKLDEGHPGSDLVGESTATLASASIVFADSDPAYSALLIQHAEEMFSFADNFRGKYTDEGGIPAVGTYTSGGYIDELCWAAIWLYKATGDETYLDKAKELYDELPLQTQSPYKSYRWSIVWDDKAYGCYVLMAQLTGEQEYKDDAERHLDWWTDGFEGERISYTDGGLAWLFQWGSLRHAMNASLTALIYSETVDTPNKQKYHDFALSQLNYSLGDNPDNRSYVTGFGNNPPTKPHHRGQHSSWIRSEDIPVESRHTLWGALVGGPNIEDEYEDDRGDFVQNEVACDFNAGFQGVVAGMVKEYGGSELPNFPQPETPGQEFLNEVRLNSDQTTFTEVAVWMNNRTGWPARIPGSMSFRYFFDITEGVEAGFSISDYTARATQPTSMDLDIIPWDEDNNVYYVEVTKTDDLPFPAGQESYRRETQMRISFNGTAADGAWDPTNDYSYQGLSGGLIDALNVPMYVDGELAWGEEPAGGNCSGIQPEAVIATSITSGFAPLVVDFDASGSSSPDNSSLTYAWDFGDGNTANTVTATNTFDIGTYTVTLEVTNETGCFDRATTTITSEEDDREVTVAIVTPTDGQFFQIGNTIDIAADAASSFGDIESVTFFVDGDEAIVDPTAPYTYALEGAILGTYVITATTVDSEGNEATSAPVEVNVVESIPPTVAITSPADGTGITTGATLDVTVEATDQDGSVEVVVLLLDGVIVGQDDTAPYSFEVTGLEVGTYVLSAEATDNDANSSVSDVVTVIVNEQPDCSFGTPMATALPTLGNAQYDNIFVLGNGPDLSNVTNFTINWANETSHNGLYQLSMLTNDGQPNWWNDLRAAATIDFLSPMPEITFSGSGFPGLDGEYYVAEVDGDFAMVSKTGGYTLYFSTSSTEPDCGATVSNERVASALVDDVVSLFPNPSTDNFYLQVKPGQNPVDVLVSDQLGRVIFEQAGVSVDTGRIQFGAGFGSGLYQVQVISGEESKTYKIMKK